MLTIRNEEPRDYEIVERMTRNSFYNLYIPVLLSVKQKNMETVASVPPVFCPYRHLFTAGFPRPVSAALFHPILSRVLGRVLPIPQIGNI